MSGKNFASFLMPCVIILFTPIIQELPKSMIIIARMLKAYYMMISNFPVNTCL